MICIIATGRSRTAAIAKIFVLAGSASITGAIGIDYYSAVQ
jgi:hypothetical protein